MAKNAMSDTPQGERKIAADALLHEHDFVASLIPLYRQFQMQLLRYGLLAYFALLGLLAARLSADALPKVLPAALALMPYPISFMLLAFATTEVRIKRASRHIAEAIAPKLKSLSGGLDVLTWEAEPGRTLNLFEKALSTSLSFVLVLGAPAMVGSVWFLIFSDTTIRIIGWGWALAGFLFLLFSAVTAAFFSGFHEFRRSRKEHRFKDAQGDDWTRQSGFRFRNLRTNEMRFLKKEDTPKDLDLEKADEEELRRLLDLATPI